MYGTWKIQVHSNESNPPHQDWMLSFNYYPADKSSWAFVSTMCVHMIYRYHIHNIKSILYLYFIVIRCHMKPYWYHMMAFVHNCTWYKYHIHTGPSTQGPVGQWCDERSPPEAYNLHRPAVNPRSCFLRLENVQLGEKMVFRLFAI